MSKTAKIRKAHELAGETLAECDNLQAAIIRLQGMLAEYPTMRERINLAIDYLKSLA